MTVVATEVRALVRDILERRSDVVGLAMTQRAKFQGWLKLELAARLSGQDAVEDVRLEDQYPTDGRADLSFVRGGTKWFVELRTANTNWRHASIEHRTRPITKNITEIIEDIDRLRPDRPSSAGLAIFVIFPIPRRIWTNEREKLVYHLRRIEREASLARGTVENSGEFIELREDVGLGVYAVEVPWAASSVGPART